MCVNSRSYSSYHLNFPIPIDRVYTNFCIYEGYMPRDKVMEIVPYPFSACQRYPQSSESFNVKQQLIYFVVRKILFTLSYLCSKCVEAGFYHCSEETGSFNLNSELET